MQQQKLFNIKNSRV